MEDVYFKYTLNVQVNNICFEETQLKLFSKHVDCFEEEVGTTKCQIPENGRQIIDGEKCHCRLVNNGIKNKSPVLLVGNLQVTMFCWTTTTYIIEWKYINCYLGLNTELQRYQGQSVGLTELRWPGFRETTDEDILT